VEGVEGGELFQIPPRASSLNDGTPLFLPGCACPKDVGRQKRRPPFPAIDAFVPPRLEPIARLTLSARQWRLSCFLLGGARDQTPRARGATACPLTDGPR